MRKEEQSITSIHRVLKEDEQRMFFLLVSFPKRKLMKIEIGKAWRSKGAVGDGKRDQKSIAYRIFFFFKKKTENLGLE